MAETGQTIPVSGAADTGKDSTSGAKPDAYLEPIRKQLEGIQSLIGRFGNELGTLRKQVERTGQPTIQPQGSGLDLRPAVEEDPERAEVQALRAEVEESRRERELDRFARTSGASPKDWEEITSRLTANESQYHVYRRDQRTGQAVLDFHASYDKVWKEIQLERVRNANQATEQQRAEQDRQRQAGKAASVVSGAGATGTEQDETLDVRSMSSAEYLEKVLKPSGLVDPNDPPNTRPYLG